MSWSCLLLIDKARANSMSRLKGWVNKKHAVLEGIKKVRNSFFSRPNVDISTYSKALAAGGANATTIFFCLHCMLNMTPCTWCDFPCYLCMKRYKTRRKNETSVPVFF
jgi:hypothetical protein